MHEAGTVLWEPSPEQQANTQLQDVLNMLQERGVAVHTYDDLHRWSIDHQHEFWKLLLELSAQRWSGDPDPVRVGEMPQVSWFPNLTGNAAREMLEPVRLASPDQPAIISIWEGGEEHIITYRELRRMVGHIQDKLLQAGLQHGDYVVAFSANQWHTIAVFLAAAASGMQFATSSPDFGAEAAAARFAQLNPKALFASCAYRYGGKEFDVSNTVAELLAELPEVSLAVALPYPGTNPTLPTGVQEWDAFIGNVPETKAPTYVDVPFDYPLYTLFSSGTTGLPKAFVHRAGGAMLMHYKEQVLNMDIKPGDVVSFFTTCGWMMWNWLVSNLAQAATIVVFDGSPAYPDQYVQFDFAERHGVTMFGTSARFVHGLLASGARPSERYALEKLRVFAVTGSPLSVAGFSYVYEHIKEDVLLASVSGGTDIVGCFIGGVPTLEVRAGELQRPMLGIDLRIFDQDGKETDDIGELVCVNPLPSMPLKFLGDDDFSRYHEAYFDVYDGMWRHGDLVEKRPGGGYIIHGRSDTTLNPGGVRIGTAEIYRPLDAFREFAEVAAVGKWNGADQEIWLLVVMNAGVELTDELIAKVKHAIRSEATPRHVPKEVIAVPDLPRTRSGKLMELAITAVINGRPVRNESVIANPESLSYLQTVAPR